MTSHDRNLEKWIRIAGPFGGLMLATVFCLSCLMAYETYWPHTWPIRYGNGYITAWPDADGGTVINYVRPVKIIKTVTGINLLRSIDCIYSDSRDRSGKQHTHTFDLMPFPLIRNYKVREPTDDPKDWMVGDQDVNRTAMIPYPLPVGAPCQMRTEVRWWPGRLAMSPQIMYLRDVDFVVDKEYSDVRKVQEYGETMNGPN